MSRSRWTSRSKSSSSRSDVGHRVLLQQLLQPAGPVALPFPAHDRSADLGPPRVHLLRDGGVDLGEEIGELVRSGSAGRRDGGTVGRRGRRLCRPRRLLATLLRPAVPLSRRSADQHARLVRIQRPLAHRLVGDQPIQGAEQLAHVVDRETGHRLEHAVRERGPPLFRLPTKDGDPGLVVGRGDVDDETTGEPADQPLVQRLDLRWRAVAGEDDLPIGGLERVGEPEQLRLHLAPVGQELDVVHQQQIHVEESLPVRLAVTGGDRGMKGLHELIEGEILDVEVAGRSRGPRGPRP